MPTHSYLPYDNWVAIQVRPKHEKTTAWAIRQKGYEELAPTYLCRRRWSDRVKDVELPLFPGYVFCRCDPQVRAPLLTTPGVCRIIGGVAEQEMLALHRLMLSGQGATPWPYLEAGAKIRIQAGPLAGVEGIVVIVKDAQRLVVSVTLLRRSVMVEVEPRWLAPAASVKSSLPVKRSEAEEDG